MSAHEFTSNFACSRGRQTDTNERKGRITDCTDVTDMVGDMYKTKFGQRLCRTFVFFEKTADYTDFTNDSWVASDTDALQSDTRFGAPSGRARPRLPE
jgi:hypothetical protein